MKELILGEGKLEMKFSHIKYPLGYSDLDKCHIAFTVSEDSEFYDLGYNGANEEDIQKANAECDVLLTITTKEGLNLLIDKLNNLKSNMNWE